jgi:hypothetical protein
MLGKFRELLDKADFGSEPSDRTFLNAAFQNQLELHGCGYSARNQSSGTPRVGKAGEGVILEIAALDSKSDAEALVNILKRRGYPVSLVTPQYAHAGDDLFRVQVGPFKTYDDAEKVRAKLSREGFKPLIRR